MKTTLDLPDDLVRRVKLRALHDGRKLKDTMADLLRKGLNDPAGARAGKATRVKLPIVRCKRTAKLSPEQVSAELNSQEVKWHREASRH